MVQVNGSMPHRRGSSGHHQPVIGESRLENPPSAGFPISGPKTSENLSCVGFALREHAIGSQAHHFCRRWTPTTQPQAHGPSPAPNHFQRGLAALRAETGTSCCATGKTRPSTTQGVSMKVVDWASFDVRHVPTEVLEEVRSAVNSELTARRRECAVQKARQTERVHCAEKLRKHPKPHHQYNRYWLEYLDELMQQDWSSLYRGGDDQARFYVYAHVRPSGKIIRHQSESISLHLPGQPFYIGKGCGSRAFDLNRNQGHGAVLRELFADGAKAEKIVHILFDGLTEAKAFEIEAKLIYFFGTQYQRGRRGLLVNLDVPVTPFD